MIFLAVVVFAGTFVYLFQRSRPKEALYEEQEAKVGDIVRSTVVTGKIQPRDEVNIKPQISGIISELYKEAGQMVKKDEIIAKVKVIPDMGSLSSAQSRVRLAEVNMNQAKTNYNREKALYDKELVSADEYEKVLQAYNQAKEELAGAKEALEIIRDGVSSANASGSSTLVRSTISGLILDVPLKVTVELGRTHKSIKEVLELTNGSIVELDKLAGEPVDIQVHGKFLAKGEVVVIDENFGVRITEIASPAERAAKLQ